jgi:hypothetical protein
MNESYIEIEVSLEDYKKIMNLDEFDIERKMLQTSAAQYIHISLQPERNKREGCNCPNRYLLNGEYAGKYCRCDALNSSEEKNVDTRFQILDSCQ